MAFTYQFFIHLCKQEAILGLDKGTGGYENSDKNH
jgi:hypothetical protein